MGVPKGFRNNIQVNVGKTGPEKRQEILDGIADQGTFLPRGVAEEDMDKAFLEFIKANTGLEIILNGEKVPVLFLTIQRWTEFSQTWQHSDKYKDVEIPFITVVRKPDIQQGQNQAGLWNIPGKQTYSYIKVPTWDGIREGVDLYKIPQPTSVDITYEVRLFTNRMKDLNKFNGKVQRSFQSRQHYIDVNGHPMPLHLESIGDESNIEDFENKRFYVQLFEMKLLGYILDEDDFEIIPTINRSLVFTELIEARVIKSMLDAKIEGTKATFTFVFEQGGEPEFSFVSKYDLNFTELVGVQNITRIVIHINGLGVFDGLVLTSPIIIEAGDTVKIKIYKPFLTSGRFQLVGEA